MYSTYLNGYDIEDTPRFLILLHTYRLFDCYIRYQFLSSIVKCHFNPDNHKMNNNKTNQNETNRKSIHIESKKQPVAYRCLIRCHCRTLDGIEVWMSFGNGLRILYHLSRSLSLYLFIFLQFHNITFSSNEPLPRLILLLIISFSIQPPTSHSVYFYISLLLFAFHSFYSFVLILFNSIRS